MQMLPYTFLLFIGFQRVLFHKHTLDISAHLSPHTDVIAVGHRKIRPCARFPTMPSSIYPFPNPCQPSKYKGW